MTFDTLSVCVCKCVSLLFLFLILILLMFMLLHNIIFAVVVLGNDPFTASTCAHFRLIDLSYLRAPMERLETLVALTAEVVWVETLIGYIETCMASEIKALLREKTTCIP